MNLTAQQYRDVLHFLLERIRNIPNQTYLRYPDGFVKCGGIPITNFNLDHVRNEQDFEFLSNSDYEFDSLERFSYQSLPNDMAKHLLEFYRNFIERFNLSLEYIFSAYYDYLMHTHTILSGYVTLSTLEEINKAVSFDPDRDKELYIYPAPYNNIYNNAYKTRKSWAKQLISCCMSSMCTVNPEAWNFSSSIYTLMNMNNILPLEPSEGLSIIDDIDLEEYEIPILTFMPYVRSSSQIAGSLLFSPEDFIELITDVLAAMGLIYTSNNNIVFGYPMRNTRNILQYNQIDLEPLMNNLLDSPNSWNKARRNHLSRAMTRLKIVEEIDDFYQQANTMITMLEVQLQNTYIKHLEDEANKLVPPQVVEYHNQYSW